MPTRKLGLAPLLYKSDRTFKDFITAFGQSLDSGPNIYIRLKTYPLELATITVPNASTCKKYT